MPMPSSLTRARSWSHPSPCPLPVEGRGDSWWGNSARFGSKAAVLASLRQAKVEERNHGLRKTCERPRRPSSLNGRGMG
jgi:hypothetical protein